MLGEHVVAHGRGGGAVEGVEQLSERHRGWPLGPVVLAAAGVGDHQRLGGRGDRVEQQLAVLGAEVALAGAGAAGQHVVTVDPARAREDTVVEPDEADHAVRHRAHRHHRADGQGAGAEVGAGGSSAQALWQQRADVGLPEHRVLVGGAGGYPGQLAVELGDLPVVVERGRGQPVHALAEHPGPVDHRAGGLRPGQEGVQAVDELRQPAGQLEVAVADVVDGQRAGDLAVVEPGHGGAQQHPLDPGRPGVGRQATEPERRRGGRRRTPSGCRPRRSTGRCVPSRRRRSRSGRAPVRRRPGRGPGWR